MTARRLLLLENVASFLQKKDRVCYIVLYQQIESRRNLCLQDNMRNIMKYILQDSVFAPFFFPKVANLFQVPIALDCMCRSVRQGAHVALGHSQYARGWQAHRARVFFLAHPKIQTCVLKDTAFYLLMCFLDLIPKTDSPCWRDPTRMWKSRTWLISWNRSSTS